MKNKILIGILGLSLILPLSKVKATERLESVTEGENSTNANVTVGEVETPVYNVEIYWDTLTYNWKYNYETNQYEWKVGTTKICDKGISISENDWESFKGTLYTDSTCDTPITEEITHEEYVQNIQNYYKYSGDIEQNKITILDASKGGEIIPSIKWTSANDYQYVQGNFQYMAEKLFCDPVSEELFENMKQDGTTPIYSDSNCMQEFNYDKNTQYTDTLYYSIGNRRYTDLTTEEIPEDGRLYMAGSIAGPAYENGAYYFLKLNLNNNTNPTTTPKKGDTIGTVTITIKADE